MKVYARILLVLLLCVPALAAEEAHVTPGDNLVVESIPPIPASLAETVGRYTDYRSASHQSWHPTKREMLISTRFGDTTQIHRLKTPGGARYQLTFFTDRVGGADYQPTRGDYFVFSKDVGGGEWFQKFRYDLATGKVTLLTDGRSRNTGGVWSNAGDRYAYQSTRRTGRTSDIWVMDPADPAGDRLLLEVPGGGWFAVDWSPDDRWLLVGEYISVNQSVL
ncbi:MAG: TolB family protein, partial [Terriglobia bacterium]